MLTAALRRKSRAKPDSLMVPRLDTFAKPERAWRCEMPKTRREFSPEFKRETVALLESRAGR